MMAYQHVVGSGRGLDTTYLRSPGGRDTAAGSLRTPRSYRTLDFGRSRLPRHAPETYLQPDGLPESGEEQTRASCQLLNNKRMGELCGEGSVFGRWKVAILPERILHDNNT